MKFFKEWIRLPGIIAAVVIAALVYFVGQLISGFMLKAAIEEYGSEAVGAKVDVGSASMAFLPPKIEFTDIAVADPDQPMSNMLELAEIKADLDLYQLVVGRVVINELNYTGLKFSTPRSTSGAIEKKAKPVEEEKPAEPTMADELAGELPNADEILAKEPLLSQELSDKLQADYQQCDSQWNAIKTGLASSGQFSEWGDEIKQLTSGKITDLADAERRASRLKEIRKLLKEQVANYKQAKEHLSSCNKELKKQVSELKAAPGKDIDRLNEKYFSSGQGALSNVTQLLFGDDVQTWIDSGLEWYNKAKPVLDALKTPEDESEAPEVYGGKFIEFEEFDRQADFAIRQMKGDVTLDIGQLSVSGKDLNADHAFSGKASFIHFAGEQLQGVESVKGDLEFDRIAAADDSYQVTINQYQLKDFVLSEDASLPLTLAEAVVDIKTSASYTEAGFQSQSVASFSSASFAVGEQASSTVKKVFSSMQQDLQRFTITLDFSKADGDFSTAVRSDLDKIIGSGIKNALKAELDNEKKKLKAKLQQQAEAKLKEQLAGIDALAGLEKQVGKDGQGLDELLQSSLKDPLKQLQEQKEAELKAELEAKKDAEKKKAKKKLLDKLGF